jgi:5'-3' exonuclease
MLLCDFSQICISNIYISALNTKKTELNEDFIRHMVLNSIRAYRMKFADRYGTLVLACDQRKSWRKDIYPYYKANRKKYRDESKLDWNHIYYIIDIIIKELREYFPYIVLQEDLAEADDIIATLCYNVNEEILIISGDKDFGQLHCHKVKQYAPVQKKFVHVDNPTEFLLEHIIRGDSGDGIPNILSPDKTFVEGLRQKKITENRYLNIKQNLKDVDSLFDNELKRNYIRNKKMVDLKEIPDEISGKILNKYHQ